MNEEQIIYSEYPCLWVARFDCEDSHLTIPYCPDCDQLSKVDELSDIAKCANIRRGKICGCENLIYDKGLKLSLTKYGELPEFNNIGNETVNFCFLPTKNMINFGIINTRDKQRAYMIDLKTGQFIINGTRMNVGFARTEYPVEGHFLISKKLNKYGINHDLLQFKIARSNINGKTIIDSFNIGYSCNIEGKDYESILNINTRDFIPLISTKEK